MTQITDCLSMMNTLFTWMHIKPTDQQLSLGTANVSHMSNPHSSHIHDLYKKRWEKRTLPQKHKLWPIAADSYTVVKLRNVVSLYSCQNK